MVDQIVSLVTDDIRGGEKNGEMPVTLVCVFVDQERVMRLAMVEVESLGEWPVAISPLIVPFSS